MLRGRRSFALLAKLAGSALRSLQSSRSHLFAQSPQHFMLAQPLHSCKIQVAQAEMPTQQSFLHAGQVLVGLGIDLAQQSEYAFSLHRILVRGLEVRTCFGRN